MNWRSMKAIAVKFSVNAVDAGDGLLHDLGDVGTVSNLSEEETRTRDFMH
jgi:hypothetical protein